MARILMANFLTMVILLSQVGLPLHLHYCKGLLESVSVFVSVGCNDHEEKPEIVIDRDCCKKDIVSDCSKEKNNCCDDEIKLLTQEITSISPDFTTWVEVQPYINTQLITSPPQLLVSNFSNPYLHQGTDSGPPIYLMQHAFIFYG